MDNDDGDDVLLHVDKKTKIKLEMVVDYACNPGSWELRQED